MSILLRRWNRAADGEPQIVLVRSEPGVGKSRLIAAFRQKLEGQDHQTVVALCAPHGADSAFYPFIRLLEARWGFLTADAPHQKLDKLEAGLRAVFGEMSPSLAALLGSLLNLPVSDRYPPLDYTPKRSKEEVVRALARVLLRIAAAQPALAIVEDSHWIDPSSMGVLRLLEREMGAGAKMLLMLTFRPEFEPPPEWLGQADVTSLTLTRLRSVEAEAMLRQLVGVRDLGKAVIRQILRHAEGVPLYIEEITRAVLEEGRSGSPCSRRAIRRH